MATYTFDKIEYGGNNYVVQDSGALQLTGGQVTGPVSFGSGITVDEATLGDLVVNGSASFTNNLQANTINGVAVGNSPAFTDSNVTQTATTTNANYEILFSGTADNTTRTEGARKNSNLTYNASTHLLKNIGTFNSYSSYNDGDTTSSINQTAGYILLSKKDDSDNDESYVVSVRLGDDFTINTTYDIYDEDDDHYVVKNYIESGETFTIQSTYKVNNNTADFVGLWIDDCFTVERNSTNYIVVNDYGLGLYGLRTPTNDTDAATKKYVDDSVSVKIGGSGTSGYLAKFNGTRSLTNGPQLGSSTTTFLNNKGEWATPAGTTYTAGTGLSLSSNQFSVKLGYTTSGNNRAVQADSNGNLYVTQKDDNTNYYHTTGSWSGLTYTATANGGAGALAFTIPTGSTSTTVSAGDHTHSDYVPKSASTTIINADVLRIYNNQSSKTSQAGSNPYITTVMLGDGRECTIDEYGDGYLAIHGKCGIFLHPQSSDIKIYDATKTYAVGDVVWYGGTYYRCTTAITTAEAWYIGHWSNISASSGAVKVMGNILPVVTESYNLGGSNLKWNDLYVKYLNGNTIPSLTSQTTQAVYPIAISAIGQITSYGSAVTIVNTRGTATSGGTTLSVVNTGDMYTWNNKQDKLTNPVTGTGTSGYLAKFNGTSSITNGPQLGSGTTTYLRNDGSWATPTDTKVSTAAITSGNTYFLIMGTDTTSATTKYYDGSGISYQGVIGDANTPGTATLRLGSTNRKGELAITGTSLGSSILKFDGTTNVNYYATLPTKTGTIALTSDIISYGGGGTIYLDNNNNFQLRLNDGTTDRNIFLLSKTTTQGISGFSIHYDDGVNLDGSEIFLPDGNGIATALNAYATKVQIVRW